MLQSCTLTRTPWGPTHPYGVSSFDKKQLKSEMKEMKVKKLILLTVFHLIKVQNNISINRLILQWNATEINVKKYWMNNDAINL